MTDDGNKSVAKRLTEESVLFILSVTPVFVILWTGFGQNAILVLPFAIGLYADQIEALSWGYLVSTLILVIWFAEIVTLFVLKIPRLSHQVFGIRVASIILKKKSSFNET